MWNLFLVMRHHCVNTLISVLGAQLPVQEQQLISHEEMALTSRPHPAPRQHPPLSQADLSTTYEVPVIIPEMFGNLK